MKTIIEQISVVIEKIGKIKKDKGVKKFEHTPTGKKYTLEEMFENFDEIKKADFKEVTIKFEDEVNELINDGISITHKEVKAIENLLEIAKEAKTVIKPKYESVNSANNKLSAAIKDITLEDADDIKNIDKSKQEEIIKALTNRIEASKNNLQKWNPRDSEKPSKLLNTFNLKSKLDDTNTFIKNSSK